MRAYAVWKEKFAPNTFHLGQTHAGSIFDDCICQEHDMEMYSMQEAGKVCKKLFLHPSGHLYVHSQAHGRFLLLRSLNLSWVPHHFFVKIAKYLRKFPERFSAPLHPSREELSVLRLTPSLLDSMVFRYERTKKLLLGEQSGFSE
jgi:hypothetical protein